MSTAEQREGAPKGEHRALLIGVQRGLDPALPDRPGTCAAMRRIAERLAAGDWQVDLLLDDAPSDDRRPLMANILARLPWLRTANPALLLLSGHVRDGRFLPRDARAAHLDRTALPLSELIEALPPRSGVLLDGPADPALFAGVGWALGAGGADAIEQSAGTRGPTRFLRALVRGLSGEGASTTVSADSLSGYVLGDAPGDESTAARPWRIGQLDGLLLDAVAATPRSCANCTAVIEDAAAAFCPHCGAAQHGVELLEGGRYRLLRPLGEGGMGQVFEAHDTALGVRRALKVMRLPPGLPDAETEALRARMVQEARAAQSLGEVTHHVVRVFDVGFSPERSEPFLVMELLDGMTLTRRLADGALPLPDALSIARQMARTLALAHARTIVHRDLKPDNIMLVARDGRPDFVKLLDFGLVKMEHADVQTASGRLMGTLQYMPPEQLRGERIDARVDVFSFGAVLYEMLSGQRANPGRTQQQIFAVLLDRGVRPLSEVAPQVPPPIAALVDACLQLDPDARPADGAALISALEAFDPGSRPSLPL
ncbi:MAG: serine/threonine protein kinase, partial [Myxococcales bacterium]|nr:serine/threonine protein kinase [Myxococcales bacterium]